MTSSHHWVLAGPADHLPPAPAAALNVRCHRRLRGPYTGGGELVRAVVPELLRHDPELVAARATEIIALAPDLAHLVPVAPRTLTALADRAERTRFYAVARTQRIAHGVAEMLTEWARLAHPDGVVIRFRELDDADPTDRELVATLLRRCDPALVTVVAETDEVGADALGRMLDSQARRVAPRPEPVTAPTGDLAQAYIDSDGTIADPDVLRAYDQLSADDRARRHSARAEALVARDEPGVRAGALPFQLERGTDRAGAGGTAFIEAADLCFDGGFYEGALELALRGRRLFGDARPMNYWNLTAKVGACLSYLKRGVEGFDYFAELRAGTIDPEIHMSACYMMAMLYTRHLPKGMHDETRAVEWVNTAIAIADRHPEQHRRVFVGAFMRNARALVELHRADLTAALDLVNEAIAMTDADLGPDEQLLHRSVLLYNRAQILAAMGDQAGSLLDYDTVIRRDPDYGDYYFERAGVRRVAGLVAESLTDYAAAIRLSPPFHEAHYNRADLLREQGDEDGALRDLDYALELEPDHVDSLVNRADLLLALGHDDRARADIHHGLTLEPDNANLLSARGSLAQAGGDVVGAMADYTAAIEHDPTFAAAWANRAVLAYSVGQVLAAVADLDRAIELADDPALRLNRSIALQDAGDHERALQDLDLAVAAVGPDPDLLFRRGVSRFAVGDATGARADWRRHLAACDGPSPFAEEIRAQAADLVDPPHVARVGA